MRKFLAATAVLALAAASAQADPGNGKGGGHNGGPPTHASTGGGQQGGPKGGGKADHGSASSHKQDRGPTMAGNQDKGQKRSVQHGSELKSDHAQGHGKPAKVERKVEKRADDRRQVVRDRVDRNDFDRDGRRVDRVERFDFADNRGLIGGCPPGLAKKNNGCTPPGLLRHGGDDRLRSAYYNPGWWGYRSLGDRVFYDDGYLYRLGTDNSVLGYIPLLGGALSVGRTWPSMYQPVPVPQYYTDYYNLGPTGSYRYADNVLYRVDPQTDAITSIAALLTGDQFAIGQPMPLGYDVYNVPYAYRDRYYDTPDAMYRYADGYVYQIDPTTRLVAAAIELLT